MREIMRECRGYDIFFVFQDLRIVFEDIDVLEFYFCVMFYSGIFGEKVRIMLECVKDQFYYFIFFFV